jgi:hypothetical protein
MLLNGGKRRMGEMVTYFGTKILVSERKGNVKQLLIIKV